MSKRTWLLVGLVLGGGILLQIPEWGGHADHHAGDGHEHESMTEISDMVDGAATKTGDAAARRTVALEVSGMT